MEFVRNLVRFLVFPGLLVTTVTCTVLAIRAGHSPTLVVMGCVFLAAWPLMLLERWLPHRQRWLRSPIEFRVDLFHMLSTGAATDLFRATLFGTLFAIAAWLSAVCGGTLWPTELPMVLQLALALFIGDFGAYWVHRLAHRSPLIWRVHAMHHTSEQLHTLSSGRNHPANAILAYGSQVVPLVILGANHEVLGALSVFTAVHGMLQHCNADLRHGWLNHIFATADLHRWHHSTQIEESNTNFGSNLAVWDKVFGTWALPTTDGPDEVGLDDVEMPENFLVHLASPVTLDRWVNKPS